jgi:hypothetical protein
MVSRTIIVTIWVESFPVVAVLVLISIRAAFLRSPTLRPIKLRSRYMTELGIMSLILWFLVSIFIIMNIIRANCSVSDWASVTHSLLEKFQVASGCFNVLPRVRGLTFTSYLLEIRSAWMVALIVKSVKA